MNAYQWWEMHKLQTHVRALALQQQMAQRRMTKSRPVSATTTDWWLLNGVNRPSTRSRWLNDDARSNLGTAMSMLGSL